MTFFQNPQVIFVLFIFVYYNYRAYTPLTNIPTPGEVWPPWQFCSALCVLGEVKGYRGKFKRCGLGSGSLKCSGCNVFRLKSFFSFFLSFFPHWCWVFACIWQTPEYLKKNGISIKKKKERKKKRKKEKKKGAEEEERKASVFFSSSSFSAIALAGSSHPGEVIYLRPEPKETADVRN